jgi:cytidylate kinase
VKVFLVAAEGERARRRSADRPEADTEALAVDLRRRDERDAVNTQPADDAVVLDTTDLSIDEVVSRIARLVEAGR